MTGEVQAAGSAAAELAAEASGGVQRPANTVSITTAKPVVVKAAQPADQALADFNAEIADLGEEVNAG